MKKISVRNKGSVLVFLTILSAGVFSCRTDLLEPIPKTSISDLVAFDTPERIALQVNGLYSAMKAGNFLGGRAQIYGDIRANDFLNRTTNGVTGYLVWQHTLTETSQNDVINMWTTAYQAINQINVFLDGMEAKADGFAPPAFPATFSTTLAVNYVAEAKFLRAVAYHTLLQFYARPFADGNGARDGLPLRLQGEKSSENNDLARATVAEVYNQIITDLNDAEAGLPANYGGTAQSFTNITRAHKNTAIAFKTRVYLTKGDYASVITEGNKIVSAGGITMGAAGNVANGLSPTIGPVFNTPQESAESIFSFPFTAQNTPGGQNQLGFYFRASASTSPNPGGGEFGLNTVAGSIVGNTTAWIPTDARRAAWVYTAGTETFLGKYPSGNPYIDKAPVIRWAEVLLNLAEAHARTGAGVDARALQLVNAVRTRSNGGTLAPATSDELIADILTERRIEFLGEGLRNMDIMRLQDTFPPKGAVPAMPPTGLTWVWPIPSTELAANQLMTRN